MLEIFKYEVPVKERFLLRLPRGAKIISFQAQRDTPQVWVLMDPTRREYVDHELRLVGIGQPIEESDNDLHYIGTCQMREGALVWHLFEIIKF